MPHRLLLILFSLIALLAQSSCQAQHDSTLLSAKEFRQHLQQAPHAQCVDVRTPEEYAEGHLDAAVNINYRASDFEQAVGQLDKAKPVYVYCRSGGRSAKAASLLRKKGFSQVYDMEGGILSWEAAGLPSAKSK